MSKYHRLTLEKFLAVRRALRAGKRFITIARELDLSLWTIAKIHDEERFQFDPVSEDELPEDDAPADFEAHNLRRCPGCGAMVYVWPCLACQAVVAPRVEPAPEVDDEMGALTRLVELAACGRRRRFKRDGEFRARLARAQVRSEGEETRS